MNLKGVTETMDEWPVMPSTPSGAAGGRAGARQARALAAIVLAAAVCLGCASAAGGSTAAAAPEPEPAEAVAAPPATSPPSEASDDGLTPLERQWGIELIGIRRTAADHMVDVRYKVLDATKAAPLFDRQNKAVLIHKPSGAEIPVFNPAKTGPLRSTNPPLEGRTYFMFFSNPSHMIKMGDPVILKIGDYEASTSVQ